MLFSVPLQTIVGLLLANAVFSLKRTKRAFETIFFLPYIIAPIAIGAIFSNLFDWQYGYINEMLIKMGLIDEGIYFLQNETMTRVIIVMLQVWRHFGYCMVIYMAGMTAISPEIYEAARIDGANEWQLFSKITVPQLSNLTVFLIMTSIINGMQAPPRQPAAPAIPPIPSFGSLSTMRFPIRCVWATALRCATFCL